MAPKHKVQLPPVPAPEPDGPSKKQTSQAVKYYLVAFNIISALAWAYVLITLSLHLLGVSFSSASSSGASRVPSASARIASLLRPLSKASSGTKGRVSDKLIGALLQRASTAYSVVGPETTLVQSLAILEVVHAALGWVRSPVGTTAAQVASRLFTVWGICERFESARTSPLYASMVLAWSLTEVIRYPFYALTLLSPSHPSLAPPPFFVRLRYSTFLVLYPLGATSEAFVNFATLPHTSPIPTSPVSAWFKGGLWTPYDYFRGALFLIWWPGLYVMYTYMLGQRRKVLGKGAGNTLGDKPKSL